MLGYNYQEKHIILITFLAMQPVSVLPLKKQTTHFLVSMQQRTEGEKKKISITQKSRTDYCMQLHIQTYLENVPLKGLLGIPVILDYLIPWL